MYNVCHRPHLEPDAPEHESVCQGAVIAPLQQRDGLAELVVQQLGRPVQLAQQPHAPAQGAAVTSNSSTGTNATTLHCTAVPALYITNTMMGGRL